MHYQTTLKETKMSEAPIMIILTVNPLDIKAVSYRRSTAVIASVLSVALLQAAMILDYRMVGD